MVYEQEYDFLEFCHELIENGMSAVREKNQDKLFKGLGSGGQDYFSKLVSKKCIQYLLEKGGIVPGILLKDGKRMEDCSYLSYPFSLQFSNDIIRFFLMLFNNSQKIDKAFTFSNGDRVLLLCLTEDYYANRRFISVKNDNLFNYFINSSYLLCLFYIGKVNEISHLLIQDRKKYFDSPLCWEILFSLRFYLRDCLGRQFMEMLTEGSYQEIMQFGKVFDEMVTPLLCSNDRTEVFEPLLQVFDMVFGKDSCSLLIEEKITKDLSCPYESDRVNARRELLPLFRWAKLILEMQKKSTGVRVWDDNYEYFSIFKKFYSDISESSKNNAKAAIDYIENII